jgi:hypothetical protein
MLPWQWFLGLAAMSAAGGFHLLTQRTYKKARGAFIVAAIALIMPVVTVPVAEVELIQVVIALSLVGFLLAMVLRVVSDKQNPEVATLTVGPEQVWAQKETNYFGVQVKLQNGGEPMGFVPKWGLTLRTPEGMMIVLEDALQKHGGIGVVGPFTLTEHQAVDGFLTLNCSDSFPKGMRLHGVTFIVSVRPAKGHVKDKSFRVSGDARI